MKIEMTPRDAIWRIKRHNEIHSKKERQAILITEAMNMAIKALEKQIPKKIEIWNGQCACPNCGKLYGNYSTFKQLTTWEMPYCKYCGQALDWSE